MGGAVGSAPFFCSATGSNNPPTRSIPTDGTPVFLTITGGSGGGWNAPANPMERVMGMKCDQLSKFPVLENSIIIFLMQ